MAEAAQTPLKMKDLESLTGVSREAIHFYLREGLLPEPERPKRNVAWYSQEHVVRIRAIKQLQQDNSLTLESIRRQLKDFDYAALTAGDDLARFEMTVQSLVNGELPAPNQSIETVMQKTGLSLDALRALHDAGVIVIRQQHGAEQLDSRDVGILELWAHLQKLGFDESKGYDASYLQRFAHAMKTMAELDVAQFLNHFSEMGSDEAAQQAARGINITNEILSRLRTQAIMHALHRQVDPAK